MHNRWKKWKSISKKFTSFQATLALTLIYVLFLIPLSFIIRVFFKHVFLGPSYKKKENTYWIKRNKVHYDITWAKEQ